MGVTFIKPTVPTTEPNLSLIDWKHCQLMNTQDKGQNSSVGSVLTQSIIWQDMSRPLDSGCKQDTVTCKPTRSELASQTLHSVIAKKRNRQSTTSPRTVPSGGNRDTRYGRRMSQPPTSCGEQWKTCAAPPNSWQHVD